MNIGSGDIAPPDVHLYKFLNRPRITQKPIVLAINLPRELISSKEKGTMLLGGWGGDTGVVLSPDFGSLSASDDVCLALAHHERKLSTSITSRFPSRTSITPHSPLLTYQFVSPCSPDRYSARPGRCTRYALAFSLFCASQILSVFGQILTCETSKSADMHPKRLRAAATMVFSTQELVLLVLQVPTCS